MTDAAAAPLPLSRTERAALADLLADVGPDAPTRCEGWTTRHLAAHLVVRDRRPDAMPGMALGGPLGRWSERVMDRVRLETDWVPLVARVRSGPPAFLPTAWPALDRVLNSAEMAIHHEDVRRAQPGWAPRALPRAAQDELWGSVPFMARAGQRGLAGSLVLRRTDAGDAPAHTRGAGRPTTTVSGEPLEVLLWASGREDVARVEVVRS